MSGFDIFGLCARNLIKRKLRTFLTLLGVIIGTASIILMMSLGMATSAQFDEMMDNMGFDMTVISVWSSPWRMSPDGNWEMLDFFPELDDTMMDTFMEIPGVTVASPLINGTIYMRSGRYAADVSWDVIGIRPAALPLMGLGLAEGRFIEEGDGIAAVFGSIAELFFYVPASNDVRMWNLWELDIDNIEPLVDVMNDPIQVSYDHRIAPSAWGGWGGGGMMFGGGMFFVEGGGMGGMGGMDDDDDFGGDEISGFRPISRFDLNVVGLLESTGQSWDDRRIFMDIEVLQEFEWLRGESQREDMRHEGGFFSPIRNQRERATYDNAFVRVESIDDTHRVAEIITEMGFDAHYPGEWIDVQRRNQESIRVLLIAIAAISLLVATINIANTMITSVTERTKEIGVMKVIGAAIKDIRRMFLLEAIMIGVLGGMLGIGVSLIGSYVLNNFEIGFLEGLGPPDLGAWGPEIENAMVSLVTPELLLLALGVAAGIGLIAGYFPARRATKLSALAAIRSE